MVTKGLITDRNRIDITIVSRENIILNGEACAVEDLYKSLPTLIMNPKEKQYFSESPQKATILLDCDISDLTTISPSIFKNRVRPTMDVIDNIYYNLRVKQAKKEFQTKYVLLSDEKKGHINFLIPKRIAPLLLREVLMDKPAPLDLPPPKKYPLPVKKVTAASNLDLLINAQDQLLLEGKVARLEDIKPAVKLFMTNPNDDPNVSVMEEYTRERCEQRIADLKSVNVDLAREIHRWELLLEAVEVLGDFRAVRYGSAIIMKTDHKTTYAMYLKVQKELTGALEELRNALAVKLWNRKYTDLDKNNADDSKKIRALQQIYPIIIKEETN